MYCKSEIQWRHMREPVFQDTEKFTNKQPVTRCAALTNPKNHIKVLHLSTLWFVHREEKKTFTQTHKNTGKWSFNSEGNFCASMHKYRADWLMTDDCIFSLHTGEVMTLVGVVIQSANEHDASFHKSFTWTPPFQCRFQCQTYMHIRHTCMSDLHVCQQVQG